MWHMSFKIGIAMDPTIHTLQHCGKCFINAYLHLCVGNIRLPIKIPWHMNLHPALLACSEPLLTNIRIIPHGFHILHVHPVIPILHAWCHYDVTYFFCSRKLPRHSPWRACAKHSLAYHQHGDGKHRTTRFCPLVFKLIDIGVKIQHCKT